ncbi:MAG: lantibiotic dehydratase family protein, partial [Deltaproteobacteria bacterium]|nr:lantibiotic dehydratase family protein [Deltaproteobacteria bacterium]
MSRRPARSRWNLGRGFVLRCPSLPFDGLASEGPVDASQRRAWLRAQLDQPLVREALSLASPGLVAELPAWQDDPETPRGQRIERSLMRYLSRMSGRATPFGLFSGIAVGTWGQRNALSLPNPDTWTRHTRIDGQQ